MSFSGQTHPTFLALLGPGNVRNGRKLAKSPQGATPQSAERGGKTGKPGLAVDFRGTMPVFSGNLVDFCGKCPFFGVSKPNGQKMAIFGKTGIFLLIGMSVSQEIPEMAENTLNFTPKRSLKRRKILVKRRKKIGWPKSGFPGKKGRMGLG